jgi:hypothetical protein
MPPGGGGRWLPVDVPGVMLYVDLILHVDVTTGDGQPQQKSSRVSRYMLGCLGFALVGRGKFDRMWWLCWRRRFQRTNQGTFCITGDSG